MAGFLSPPQGEGFKHSEAYNELMKKAHKERIVSEETKLKIAVSNSKAQATMLINNITGEVLSFTFVVFIFKNKIYIYNKSCRIYRSSW